MREQPATQAEMQAGGNNVRAQSLRQHTTIENLLTDATQQPLEFYDSRLSAKVAAVTPVVSPFVLLGESACRAASTAPSPAACSNELLEILYGLDAHTVEVDDAVSLHLYSEYVYSISIGTEDVQHTKLVSLRNKLR